MFNCLLDGFPDEYKGYKINTDFKIGILLSLLIDDKSVDEDLKMLQSFNLLYKDKVPSDLEMAFDGVIWFLSCGKSEIYYEDDYIDSSKTEKCIDFNIDHLDIWGAFWARGVDLNNVDMHWFKFMSALSNLGDCPLTQKISYRCTDLSKMEGNTKKYYAELKEKYKIRNIISKEEYLANLKKMENNYGSYYMKLRSIQKG